MTELPHRIETASAEEQRGLLVEAFDQCFPKPDKADEPEWQGPGTLREPLYHHWYIRFRNFTDMLAAGAYESAALLLLLDGWTWAYLDGEAIVRKAGTWLHASGTGATPALSIAAAALRAREG